MPKPAASPSLLRSLNLADPTPVTQPFLAWEKLRLYYNLILAAITLGMVAMAPSIFPSEELLVVVIGGAIGANVCYCAGPVAENYLALIGTNRGIARAVLFGLGCLIACGLTLLAMTWVIMYVSFNNF